MKVIIIISIVILLAAVFGYYKFLKSNPLQERAKIFLKIPIPEGMSYVPDSMAERFIVEYAENGKVQLDPEMNELLQIVVMELEVIENAKPGTEEAFMNESALILQEILNEINR